MIYKYKIFTKIALLHNLHGTRTSYIWLHYIILICEPSLTLVSGISKLQCVIIYLFILLLISFRAILVEATMKWRLQHESHQEIYSTIFKYIMYCKYVTYLYILQLRYITERASNIITNTSPIKLFSKWQLKFHCNQILI